jgi:hypothetical protein
MKAAEDEIDAAVAEAYAEGYKAATARHAPLAESYRALAAETRAKLDAEQKKSRLFWPAIGASSGASLVAGFLVAFFAAR